MDNILRCGRVRLVRGLDSGANGVELRLRICVIGKQHARVNSGEDLPQDR
jgi:hypothetical protein